MKTEQGKALSSQDELKYRRKYKELRRRIRDIEADNNELNVRLQRAKKNVQRLRLERNFLFERIENQNENGVASTDSELSSGSGSDDGLEMSDLDDAPRFHRRGRKGEKGLMKARKHKDPDAPKRPGNVFFLYCRMERDKMKQEFPEEQLGDLTKLLGQRWKGLTKDEKQKYYDIFKKENEDYEIKMKDYTPKPLGSSSMASSSKGGRPPNKRPRSSDTVATAASQSNTPLNTPLAHPQLASLRGDSSGIGGIEGVGGGGGVLGAGGSYSEMGSEAGTDDDIEDDDGYDDMDDGDGDGDGLNDDGDGPDGREPVERNGSFETESEESQERTIVR